jgi:hypothetical protein
VIYFHACSVVSHKMTATQRHSNEQTNRTSARVLSGIYFKRCFAVSLLYFLIAAFLKSFLTFKVKFPSLYVLKIIVNVMSFWYWSLFGKQPILAETVIYWLGFRWVRVRVEYVPEVERGMGKFDILFCPTSHIFPKPLVSAERYCSTLYPTNINHNPLLKR